MIRWWLVIFSAVLLALGANEALNYLVANGLPG